MHEKHSCGHDHAEGETCGHEAFDPNVFPVAIHRPLTGELMKGLTENFAVVPSRTAEKWFTTANIDIVSEAVFQYIVNHQTLFTEAGDVILDAIEMANLVLAREELGLSADAVPEELVVGIIPRQIGMIRPKGQPKPEVMKNTILIGNAAEVSGMVMSAFRAYYDLEDGSKPRKTAKERFDERRKKRLRDKRKK